MHFSHRVQQVDAFLQEQEFASCHYCKEGWFGTARTKEEMPGGVECATFKKTNFLLAPQRQWLEPGRAICKNCLAEAQAREKQGLPKCPFRFAAVRGPRSGYARNRCFDFLRRGTSVASSAHSAHFHAACNWPNRASWTCWQPFSEWAPYVPPKRSPPKAVYAVFGFSPTT